jgi:hypothetical protein
MRPLSGLEILAAKLRRPSNDLPATPAPSQSSGRSATNGMGCVGDGSAAKVSRTFQRFVIIERDHQVMTGYAQADSTTARVPAPSIRYRASPSH